MLFDILLPVTYKINVCWNDREFLSAYYCFDKVEEVCVEEDKLTFGHTHQYASGLGIPTAVSIQQMRKFVIPLSKFFYFIWQSGR